MAKTPGVLALSDWEAKWQSDDIVFHRTDLNELLEKHIDVMLRGRKNIKIFFPLCGKAVDMKWLYGEGHTIIGLEASAKGCQDFFKESGLTYTSETVADGKFTLHKTEDNRLQLYCGNMFDFNSSICGKVQGIWDRGSFVAINKEDREKYSKILIDFMDKDCHYLIDIMQYDPSEHCGPPHNILLDDVRKFYGEKCNITQIDKKDSLSEMPKAWGLSKFHEVIVELILK